MDERDPGQAQDVDPGHPSQRHFLDVGAIRFPLLADDGVKHRFNLREAVRTKRITTIGRHLHLSARGAVSGCQPSFSDLCRHRVSPQSGGSGRVLRTESILRWIRARRLFGDADEFLGAIQFSRRRNYRDLTPADIERRYLRCREAVASPFPQLHASFGRAFLAHADYSAALESLCTAAEQCERQNVATTLALGVAQACTEHYREALERSE